ncbi:hypothetical protein [Terriglobus roseus]|uniref:PH domain-containing protein n=1 Tax=Terriglobus roseus TaxID=392734 RepID=A0A1G7JID9_9BACT|nr:hypothetical protein [Terriglobus roseus]SDF24697.1 hypothetical protein SAMN05444167_1832 [Terriglobus roseus]
MTFRVINNGGLTQIVISFAWVLFGADQLAGHSRYNHSYGRWLTVLTLTLWLICLFVNVLFYFRGEAQFTQHSLRIRRSLRSVFIPYSSIVSFKQARDAKGRLKQNVVELEVSELSREIYPHQYKELHLKDMPGFLAALQQYVPQQS